jgi:hypothetical protein
MGSTAEIGFIGAAWGQRRESTAPQEAPCERFKIEKAQAKLFKSQFDESRKLVFSRISQLRLMPG